MVTHGPTSLVDLMKIVEAEFDNCPFHDGEKEEISKLPTNRNGFVYQIYVDGEIRFVGKCLAGIFKTVIKAHFVFQNREMVSKIEFIKRERSLGKTVQYKYIQTDPPSMIALIESELVKKQKLVLLWNRKKFEDYYKIPKK